MGLGMKYSIVIGNTHVFKRVHIHSNGRMKVHNKNSVIDGNFLLSGIADLENRHR